MNYVFISPHFPPTYWNFCDRLKKMGQDVYKRQVHQDRKKMP